MGLVTHLLSPADPFSDFRMVMLSAEKERQERKCESDPYTHTRM